MSSCERLSAAISDRYEIIRELGRGGMATVYLARDLKHDREVAVKVLHPELGAAMGSERFLEEIKITARLDHSNILTLIDSGEAGRLLYYVIPFVRGESLRDKLERERQMSIEDTLQIAGEVASALDHAHEQGVIHRDIKPENILLRDRKAMLTDFGIALAVQTAGGSRITETGLSLGTPQYMSPEQATGDRILDARSDVYSLAAVVYEMLAGEPPLKGANVQSTIAKLLVETPTHLRVIRATISPAIDAAVSRALAKTPADRFASAGAFVRALQDPTLSTSFSTAPGLGSRRVRGLAAGTITVAIAALVGYIAFSPENVTLSLGQTERFTTDPGLEIQPSLSPNGQMVAYAAGNSSRMRIFLRPANGGRTIALSDDSTAVETQPRWSPDGSTLLFLVRGGVSVLPSLGGSSRMVVQPVPAGGVASATWAPTGAEIAFTRGDSLFVTPAAGGAARIIGVGRELHSCDWRPDGQLIACIEFNSASTSPGPLFANLTPTALALFRVGGGEVVRVTEANAVVESPRWASDGRQLLYVSNRAGARDVYAQTFSSSGKATGQATRLTTGLGAVSISLSSDGRRMAYAVYAADENIWAQPIPSSGTTAAARSAGITTGRQVIEGMRFSHDGRWLLFDSNRLGSSDIFRQSATGGEPEQLTTERADEFAGDLSPDGTALVYHSWRKGTRNIEVKTLQDGTIGQLTDNASQSQWPRWSPDGQAISYSELVPPFRAFIRRRSATGWSAPVQVTDHVNLPEWSPDGRWLACVRRDRPGEPGAVVLVPANGGPQRRLYEPGARVPPAGQAAWSHDGTSIYFKTHDARGKSAFWSINPQGGEPRLLVRFGDPNLQSPRHEFAVDRSRFYFTVEDRQSDLYLADLIRR